MKVHFEMDAVAAMACTMKSNISLTMMTVLLCEMERGGGTSTMWRRTVST